LRNVGFVKCEWAFKGTLAKKEASSSNVFGEGQTYDGKLYTFKECDYATVFSSLNIFTRKLSGSMNLKSPTISSSISGEMSYRHIDKRKGIQIQ